MGKLILIGEK